MIGGLVSSIPVLIEIYDYNQRCFLSIYKILISIYFYLGGTLPVPFNIIPSPKGIHYFFRRIFSCIKRLRKPNKDQSNSIETNNSVPPMTKPKRPQQNHTGVPTVSNGKLAHLNLNDKNYRTRQGSFDANQRLTYRKVMNRVIKRFLLHKQREEQEAIRKSDFEQLKQDIQNLRFEILNRMDETRDDLNKNSHLLNEGVVIVGDLLSLLINDSNPSIKANFHSFKRSFYSSTDSSRESTTSTLSTTSMPIISNLNNQQEGNVHPINATKQLALIHVGLTKIIEEDEKDNLHHSLPYVDDNEEEVEGSHKSSQTSMDNNDEDFSKF